MYFSHDPTQDFYYLGSEPPDSHTSKRYLVEANPRVVACDVETISLKERIAIGISIATSPTCAFYFPLFPTESPVTPWHLLKDPDIVNVYHNGIFDLSCMTEYNIKQDIQDTNIMSRLLCHRFNGLMELSWLHQMEIHEVKQMLTDYGAKIMLDLPKEEVARKCMQDSMATYKLYQIFYPQTNLEYYNVERSTLPIMIKMSERGILIDHTIRQAIELKLEDDVELYQGLCEEAEAFNPGSPQQVSYVLAKRGAYEVFGRLPFTRNAYGRPTSNLSTAEQVLEAMDDPLAQLVLEYRRRAKLLSTYIKPWANESRAYTRYHLNAICYDDQTEVLTDIGWKHFKDLTFQDSIATLNPNTWYIEYQQPTDIIATHYAGNMHSIETKQLSLLVTPEHHMYVGQRYLARKYGGALRKNYRWGLRTASEMFHKSSGFLYKKDAFWAGMEYDTITVGAKTIPMDEWLKFFGLWLAEGYTMIRKNRNNSISGVGIRHTDTDLLWGEMCPLLKSWGIKPWNTSDLSKLAFTNQDIELYLAKLGKAEDKYVPREYMELSSRQLDILLTYYLKGDGNIKPKKSGRVRRSAFTSSIRLRDDLQEIALKTGCAANYGLNSGRPGDIRTFTGENRTYKVNYQNYVIGFVDESCLTYVDGKNRPRTESYIDYGGMVYCASVPNHIMYIRRHGKTVWCGNTGRPSSTDRNMQNIPGAKSRLGINVRGFLAPDSGTWTDVDFSQLELRILAYLAQDREMLHNYETGGDIHQITADFLGINRKIAKNVGFCMVYGGTVQTIMETAHIRSMQRARQLREMWFQLYPQAGDYIRTVQHECHITGRAKTIFGRQMRLPTEEEESYDGIERKAVNYPIQGSAADILKRGLIALQDMDIALQIHDELLVDGLELPDRFDVLENIAPFKTPIEVRYLTRWE